MLLRHAKAETPTGLADTERPLTARGRADAVAAGAWLADHGYRPTLVLCSPAKRTRQTWHGAALGLYDEPAILAEPDGTAPAPAPVVRYDPTAYAASPDDLLDLSRAVEPTVRTILLVAHNPGISLLSGLLDPAHASVEGLRTGGLAVHRVRGAWASLGPDGAPLVGAHIARG